MDTGPNRSATALPPGSTCGEASWARAGIAEDNKPARTSERLQFNGRSDQKRESPQRPCFFLRPKSRIFGVNSPFNIFDLPAFLVHCIRIQRNALADPSADTVAIGITVQVVPVLIAHVAAAVARHLLQQLWHLLSNPIDLRDLAAKSDHGDDDRGAGYQAAHFPKLGGLSAMRLR
jgi:hypothetical protein